MLNNTSNTVKSSSSSADPFSQWDLLTRHAKSGPNEETLEEAIQATFTADNPEAPQVTEPTPLETTEPLVETPEVSQELAQSSDSPPIDGEATPTTESPVLPEQAPKDDWKQRYGDLRRLLEQERTQLKKMEKEFEALKNKPQVPNVTIKSKEELEGFAKENPDLYSLIKSVAAVEITDLEVRQKDLEERQQKLAAKEFMDKIKELHKDADKIKLDPLYHEWYATQTQRVQDLINYGSVEDVSWALDKYKKDLGIVQGPKEEPKVQKESTLSAAAVVPTSSTKVTVQETRKMFRESDIAKMSDRAYAKLKPEVDKALQEGRVIMDLKNRR